MDKLHRVVIDPDDTTEAFLKRTCMDGVGYIIQMAAQMHRQTENEQQTDVKQSTECEVEQASKPTVSFMEMLKKTTESSENSRQFACQERKKFIKGRAAAERKKERKIQERGKANADGWNVPKDWLDRR